MVGGCRGSTPPEIYYIQTYIYQSKRTIFPRFLCVTSQHSMEHDALWISTSLSRLKVTTAGAYALFVFTRWSRTTEKRNQVDEDGKVPWRSFSWSGLALWREITICLLRSHSLILLNGGWGRKQFDRYKCIIINVNCNGRLRHGGIRVSWAELRVSMFGSWGVWWSYSYKGYHEYQSICGRSIRRVGWDIPGADCRSSGWRKWYFDGTLNAKKATLYYGIG